VADAQGVQWSDERTSELIFDEGEVLSKLSSYCKKNGTYRRCLGERSAVSTQIMTKNPSTMEMVIKVSMWLFRVFANRTNAHAL
jgi:hypothetical protein